MAKGKKGQAGLLAEPAQENVEAARRDLATVSATPGSDPVHEVARTAKWLLDTHELSAERATELLGEWAMAQNPPFTEADITEGVHLARDVPASVGARIRQGSEVVTDGPMPTTRPARPVIVARDSARQRASDCICPAVPDYFPPAIRQSRETLADKAEAVKAAYAEVVAGKDALADQEAAPDVSVADMRQAADGVLDAQLKALQAEMCYLPLALDFCEQRRKTAGTVYTEDMESVRKLRAEVERKMRASGAGLRYLQGSVNEAPAVAAAEAQARQTHNLAQPNQSDKGALAVRLDEAKAELEAHKRRLAGIV